MPRRSPRIAPATLAAPEGKPAGVVSRGVLAAYPNPSSGPVRLELRPEAFGALATVRVSVEDVAGRTIAEIPVLSGEPAFWDGRDRSGRPVASGLYLLRAPGQAGPPGRLLMIR